jgi:hypothetical protein
LLFWCVCCIRMLALGCILCEYGRAWLQTCAGSRGGSSAISSSEEAAAVGAPAVVTRVTVSLIRETVEALAKVQDGSGRSKVDIVNRAVQLYGFIDEELRGGRRVVLRGDDGSEVLVKILM